MHRFNLGVWREEIEFVPPEKIFWILKNKRFFFWLDSISPSYGKYSIMGFDPFLIFKSKKKKITIEKPTTYYEEVEGEEGLRE